MNTALIVVDVQNDFCEGGAMGVAGGNEVARKIAELVHTDQFDRVMYSRDWHDPETDNGGHFADEPDFRDTWPAHCVQNTVGAEFHPALTVPAGDVVSKGMDAPAYSAFEGVVVLLDTAAARLGRGDLRMRLSDYLRGHDIGKVVVVGIATDYCVKATALDAASEGFETSVLLGYTAGVALETTSAAIEQMADAGVKVVGS